MAWTTPRTWVTGELVTATILNTYVRDNQSALDGGRLAITSQAARDIFFASSATAISRLAAGTSGYFLKTQSTGTDPVWAAISFSSVSPLTTRGDVLYSSSGTVTGTRLAVGSANTFLKSDGTDVAWASVSTSMGVLSKTADYTVATSDGADVIILVDASGGARVITLYAASGNSGNQVSVKKTDSSANTVTIDGNSSETIDAATTQVISAQYTSLSLVCDGSNWHIF
jgi:hypothetical protein